MRAPIRSLAAALLAAAVGTGCREAEGDSPPPPPARQYVIGIDISGSRTPAQLEESRQLLAKLIDQLRNGDGLALVQMYQDGPAPAPQWEETVPPLRNPPRATASDRRRLEDFRDIAHAQATAFFDPKAAAAARTTDVFQTLFRAADYAKGAGGRRRVVVLLSDMVHSTRELDMERPGSVPDAAWIARRKAEGRLPDLTGVCVVVVGADVSSARGAAVREFWRAYFAAAGGELREGNYRNMVADPGEFGCS